MPVGAYIDLQNGVPLSPAPAPGMSRIGFDASGNLVVVNTGGQATPVIGVPGKLTVRWNGSPGTGYGNGTNYAPVLFDQVMVQVSTGQSVTIDFPTADTASTGAVIVVINMNAKAQGGTANGEIIWNPQATDSMGSLSQAQDGSAGPNAVECYQLFRSDGNNTWWPFLQSNEDYGNT